MIAALIFLNHCFAGRALSKFEIILKELDFVLFAWSFMLRKETFRTVNFVTFVTFWRSIILNEDNTVNTFFIRTKSRVSLLSYVKCSNFTMLLFLVLWKFFINLALDWYNLRTVLLRTVYLLKSWNFIFHIMLKTWSTKCMPALTYSLFLFFIILAGTNLTNKIIIHFSDSFQYRLSYFWWS